MTAEVNGNHSIEPTKPCGRCKEKPATLLVRAQNFCDDCFGRYVRTKVIKRMESFRVRHASEGHPQKLLLPISFGVSSISLLQILDSHQKTQKQRTGRAGFDLHILYIDMPPGTADAPTPAQIALLRTTFPDHEFTTHPLPTRIPPAIQSQILPSHPATPPLPLPSFLALLPSATARADSLTLLQSASIAAFASSHACPAILYACSATRLAARAVAETAKGRGFALPWSTADAAAPRAVALHYPARDLLARDLALYARVAGVPGELVVRERREGVRAGTRGASIDELVDAYFVGVEDGYPGIVANVVRTTERLEAPRVGDGAERCVMCGMAVVDGRFGVHGWGGDQEEIGERGSRRLCYGCARSVP